MANRTCPCGCTDPPPMTIGEPPHEGACGCSYNPFAENAADTEITDLSYALRKLTSMKCQMKKWRMERLQLESEARALKQVLQAHGAVFSSSDFFRFRYSAVPVTVFFTQD